MKKIVFIVLLVIAAAASVFITITIDPSAAKAKDNVMKFHKNSEVVFAIDGHYTDDLLPKVQDEAYKAKLQKGIDAIKKIINTEIDSEKGSNLVSDVSSAKIADLEKKAVAAGIGIAKIIAIADKVEKEMPESIKSSYDKTKLAKLKAVYALIASGGSKGGTTKVLIIALIAIVAGIGFIFIERAARKSGEIKSSQVA